MRRRAIALSAVLALAACGGVPVAGTAQQVDAVRSQGSLRGTDLDGDWGAARQRRFDHLLTALGEVDESALRLWIERETSRELEPAAVREVLFSWDEHIARLQGRLSEAGEPSREPVQRPLARRPPPPSAALLTPEPTSSAEELLRLRALRTAEFGAAAADRLAAEDLARWQWTRRLSQARERLQGASWAEKETYVWLHFSGSERLRARALLGLSP